jgi:hypothetical protein
MTTHERVQAIAECGFTDRQARFLVLVMRHSGLMCGRKGPAPECARPWNSGAGPSRRHSGT